MSTGNELEHYLWKQGYSCPGGFRRVFCQYCPDWLSRRRFTGHPMIQRGTSFSLAFLSDSLGQKTNNTVTYVNWKRTITLLALSGTLSGGGTPQYCLDGTILASCIVLCRVSLGIMVIPWYREVQVSLCGFFCTVEKSFSVLEMLAGIVDVLRWKDSEHHLN